MSVSGPMLTVNLCNSSARQLRKIVRLRGWTCASLSDAVARLILEQVEIDLEIFAEENLEHEPKAVAAG